MKKITAISTALCLFLLTGAGRAVAEDIASWPYSHAGETPYIRLQNEPADQGTSEFHGMDYEEILQTLYVWEGSFCFINWEKALFESLPQDEPYSFVVHTEQFLRGGGGEDEHIRLAQAFADQGCEARVKKMDAMQDGMHTIAYVTIVTTTPSKLWELAHSMDEQLFVEQLYESVDYRFNISVWPEAQGNG